MWAPYFCAVTALLLASPSTLHAQEMNTEQNMQLFNYFDFKPDVFARFLKESLNDDGQDKLNETLWRIESFVQKVGGLDVQDAFTMVLGTNMTEQLFNETMFRILANTVSKELMEVLQNNMLDIRNWTSVMQMLTDTDWMAARASFISTLLTNVEKELPEDALLVTNAIIEGLERGEGAASTIHSTMAAIQSALEESNITIMSPPFLNSTISSLDDQMKAIYSELKQNYSDWSSRSVIERMMKVWMKVDVMQLAMDTLSREIVRLDAGMPALMKANMRQFLDNLENDRSVSAMISNYMDMVIVMGWNDIVDTMMSQFNITVLPRLVTINSTALDEFGMIGEIDRLLRATVQNITSSAAASMYNSQPDTGKLMMILSSFPYEAVGMDMMEKMMIMANQMSQSVLDVWSSDKDLMLALQSMSDDLMARLNMTDECGFTGVFINTTFSSLRELYVKEAANASWVTMDASSKLAHLISQFDYKMYHMKLLIMTLRHMDGQLPNKEQLGAFMELVRAENVDDLTASIEAMHRMMISMYFNQTDVDLTELEPVLKETSRQLIEQYQIAKSMNGDMMMMMMMMMKMSGRDSFDELTNLEQFAHIMYRINYTAIGKVLVDQIMINQKRMAQNILDTLNNADKMDMLIERMAEQFDMFIKERIASLTNMTAAQRLFDVIKERNSTRAAMNMFMSEVKKALINFGKNESWNELSSYEKLMMMFTSPERVMGAVSAAIGQGIWEMLPAADEYLMQAGGADIIKNLIDRVTQGKDVRPALDAIVDMAMTNMAASEESSAMLKTLIDTLLDSVKEDVEAATKANLDLSTVDSSTQKLALLFSKLNLTKAALKTMETIPNIAIMAIIQNISNPEILAPIIEVLESGDEMPVKLESLVSKALEGSNISVGMLFDNPLSQWVLSKFAGYMTNILQNDYPEWNTYSDSVKLTRLLISGDLMKSIGYAAGVASDALQDSLTLNLTDQCRADFATWWGDLQGGQSWAMQMVDAWGKPHAGIMLGNYNLIGMQEQCLAIKPANSSSNHSFSGAYCRGEFYSASNANYAAGAPSVTPSPSLGVCVPSSCSRDDIGELFEGLLLLNIYFHKDGMRCHAELPAVKGLQEDDVLAIVTTSVVGFIVAIVVLCSLIDRYMYMAENDKKKVEMVYSKSLYGEDNKAYTKHENDYGDDPMADHMKNGKMDLNKATMMMEHPAKQKKSDPSLCEKLVKAFSLYTTLGMLMDSTPKPNQLQALDGIRFLTMSWVILGHTYTIATVFYTSTIANIASVGNWGKDDWTFMGLPGGLFAVDTFFLLSGLLVGYLFLKMMKKLNGKLQCYHMAMYYIHRILRLTPLYGIVILMYAAYEKYLGAGPHYPGENSPILGFCQKNWWTNLVYVNNFVNAEEQCIGWSWYLANDMQFYIVSPLVLIPLYLKPVLGMTLIGLLFGGHIGVTGWLWSQYNGETQFNTPEIFTDIYIKPYARAGPYLVGLVLAFMLFKRLRVTKTIVALLWWLVALAIMLTIVYVRYDSTKGIGMGSSNWGGDERAAYETISRIAWAIGVSWVIFACNAGAGGFIGDFLSWPGWAPLSRLTYAAYLLHPIVMVILAWNRFDLIYMDHLSLFYLNMSFVTISYLAAGVFFVLFEAPFAGLEKIIFHRKK